MDYVRTFVLPHRLTVENDNLDTYARRGVTLTRDAASEVLASVSRDVSELKARGGDANLAQAELLSALRRNLNSALCNS